MAVLETGAYNLLSMSTLQQQVVRAVLMVRPVTFGFDEQTAGTNSFQHHMPLDQGEVRRRANAEFDAVVAALTGAGIKVVVFEDHDGQLKPDAVFPNNWLSTWPDGHAYMYPMNAPTRRAERSQAALDLLRRDFGITEVTDLSGTEEHGKYLEGTGAIVFDHSNKIAYGCISPRCDEELFNAHAQSLSYEPVTFRAYDQTGQPIYHTNVLMGVQRSTAVLCAETIINAKERERVVGKLVETGHQLVQITEEQMAGFCGNVLELQNSKGEHFLALSQSAYDNFTPEQRKLLAKDKQLLPVAIPTIETVGGGSLRCTLAEIFLPPTR